MPSAFELDVNNPESAIAIDLSHDGQPLFIAFGGIMGGLGVPPFEFFNLGKSFDVNKIYIRDLKQSWYQQGLPGIAENIDELAEYISQKVKQANASKIIVVGNSMGGYAALLFGALLKADSIHAFSPQTFINKLNRLWHRDFRWDPQIKKTHALSNTKYLDLKELVCECDKGCDVHIYYSSDDRLDKVHAERLGSASNLTLHSYHEGGHSVVKVLKRTGELNRIITSSISAS